MSIDDDIREQLTRDVVKLNERVEFLMHDSNRVWIAMALTGATAIISIITVLTVHFWI